MQDNTSDRVRHTDTRDVRAERDLRDGETASLVRHEEELHVGTRRVATGAVRLVKRVVTEQRTVTVRREELVVEQVPASELREDATLTGNPAKDAALEAARPHQPRAAQDEPVLEMVLHEERVVTEVVPVERVRVYVDRTTHERVVEADLAKEVVTLEQTGRRDEPGLRDRR